MSKEYRKQLADGYKKNPKEHPEYKIYYDEFYGKEEKPNPSTTSSTKPKKESNK